MAAQKRNKDWIQDYFFLIVPKPLPDELLSSWLTRMAIDHRRKLASFLSLFVKREGNRISSIDMDFLYNEKLFHKLALKSNFPIKNILDMSLRSEEGYLFACNNCLYPPKQIRKLKDKRTHNGLMFCPKCLAEDKIPYFRKKWRYYFYNACPKHKIFLTDRCWCCYERVLFSKIEHHRGVSYCSKCEKDLSTTIAIPLQSNYKYGLKAIKWFEKGLQKGYFIINHKKVASLFVFESFTNLCFLLDRKQELVLDNFPLIEQYYAVCKKLAKYDSKKATSIQKDFILASMVYFLFQNYPKNILSFADTNHLTHKEFIQSFIDVPFWYKKMIDKLIPVQNKRGREISESEVRAAIKYLQKLNTNVTQEAVANVIGCHFTIHKGFVKIYKKLVISLKWKYKENYRKD